MPTQSNLVAAEIYEVDAGGNRKGGGIAVPCMFNPYEYSVSKSNQYEVKPRNRSAVPQVEFKSAGSQTLKLKLVFDSYESQEDISRTTNKLWKLMEAKTRGQNDQARKVPPPEVAFHWGVFRFVAVVTQMTQKFSLFLPNGTPVRAEVDITFTQHVDLEDYPNQNPTSGEGPTERVWQVTAGDRIDLIAAAVYGDAGKWPAIARHNGIVNPHTLTPGMQLNIPPA